ncbi:deoxyribonuclease IV [Anaerotignum lactatifermentans]|uniref:Probable endonuclease 4 n=1 Tax=Anaerotignum lactatifermentans TaxID=160404 RepID=A0ABS2G9U1_9FIRM|nr:deoxyribonuclease IV [Anaerotignum lactatifermentans]MBM6829113.1 deoxyribonuclease IV [Anaerotignum lactatifermentans]MBM6877279.1 deoxyribonuclease IV [Anaerotignum lactatifermentans]MBM6950652.1 deoxyribonuclease IV [Anaerotignum lactatifermentans]
MFFVGCHLSASKGYLAMGKTAVKIGANSFQFFTRNPRGGNAKALDVADVEAYLAFARENGIGPILAHAPYTLNACAADENLIRFAEKVMREDLERLAYLPEALYNFHPGSHVKQGADVGIEKIAALLNRVLTPEVKTPVLLETMAGKGTEVGRSFQELRQIIDRVELQEKMGVCLDTCHVFDGGYDIVGNLDGVLEEFDRVIGLERLRAVHLNDSKNPLGSHKDRHACLDEGEIGIAALEKVINHPALREVPFLLETPNELEGYAKEIAWLKELRKAD